MNQREPLLDRFIRYAKIDTQSSDTSTTYPSTEKQKDLLRVLVEDLNAAGLADAAMDEWGYVMATLPSNVPADHPAHGKVPTVGLIAHVQALVDEIVTLDEAAIAGAVRWVFDEARLVAEPSGAAPVAAALGRGLTTWSRDGACAARDVGGLAVAIVSGGNVEAGAFSRYIT